MSLTSTSTLTPAEIAQLAQVGVEVGLSYCKGEVFFSSNKIQTSLATALHKMVKGIEITILSGKLFINETQETWKSIALATVDGQWIGPGRVYPKDELQDKIKEACLVESRAKIEELVMPRFTMDYVIIRSDPSRGACELALVDLMVSAMSNHLQENLLEAATPTTRLTHNPRRF